jgi:beta-fructofuranosidase
MNVNVGGGAGKEPKWGGALVCHKVVQHEDGTLTLGEVPAIKAKYTQEQVLTVMKSNGYVNGKLTGDNAYVLYNRLGNCNHISMTVKTEGDGDKFGISLVRGTDSKKYYTMVVNPEEGNAKRKINFEQEGEEGQGFVEGIDGNIFPRPADNTYKIDIYTDNTVMVMYINDNVCYTQRIYGITKNCWSINNYGGSITVSDVKVSQQ